MANLLPPVVHPNPMFKPFIISLLKQSGITKKRHVLLLTNETAMKEWTKVVTTRNVHPTMNYELYETFGDALANNIVLWFFKKQYPQQFDPTLEMKDINGMGVVGVLTRFKQLGVEKKMFSTYGEKLGFSPFVRATEEDSYRSKSILEDVFEAFIGCLGNMVDTKIQEFFGYAVAFKFMVPLMEKEVFSFEKESLYDANSLLNEDLAYFLKKILTVSYEQEKTEFPNDYRKRFKMVLVLKNQTGNKSVIYRSPAGYGPKKKEASLKATENTRADRTYKNLLAYLHRNREKELSRQQLEEEKFQREHPDEYLKIARQEEEERAKLRAQLPRINVPLHRPFQPPTDVKKSRLVGVSKLT